MLNKKLNEAGAFRIQGILFAQKGQRKGYTLVVAPKKRGFATRLLERMLRRPLGVLRTAFIEASDPRVANLAALGGKTLTVSKDGSWNIK